MPFTVDQFFNVFARYNAAIWPLPVVAYATVILILILLLWKTRLATILISLALAAMWIVNGIGYHWLFFSEVNPIAKGFAGLFVAEGVALAAAPLVSTDLLFAVRRDARSVMGLAMIVFAVLIYPLWGSLAGHSYPAAPMFGVAPCPTTIFTIGVLLMGPWRVVRWLLIIPSLWTGIGGSAALLLNVPQDLGLIVALIIVLTFTAGHWLSFSFARHSQPVR